MRGLALGALLGGIIACGAARAPSGAPPVAPSSVMPEDPHAQIDALARDITARGGTFVPQASMAAAATPLSVPAHGDPACHPAETQACTDVCTVGDAICDDAKKICDIAVKLDGDTWAAGKCESGKQSCSEAHAHCCACQ